MNGSFLFQKPYIAALDRPDDPLYSHEPTRDFYPSNKLGIGTAAGVTAGILAAGSLNYKGKPLWNTYTQGLRWIEGYSPGFILSTFQLGTFSSQFADYGPRFIRPEEFKHASAYTNLTAAVIGGPKAYERLLQEGLTVKGGSAYWGEGTEQALKYASIVTTPGGTRNYIASAHAYSLGVGRAIADELKSPLSSYFGLDKISTATGLPRIPQHAGMPGVIIGGHTLGQHIGRQASALGTEFVSRFNRLLAAAAGMEPLKTGFSYLQRGFEYFGRQLALEVPEDSGLKMLGALTKKYGFGLGALAIGYSSLDYVTRNLGLLDSTILDEGITVAGATLLTQGQMGLSRLAEVTGLHDYRENQEAIAPGSTSLSRLIGFPMAGGFIAGLGAYGVEVSTAAKLRAADPTLSVYAAKTAAREHMSVFRGEGIFSRVGRSITRSGGLYSSDTLAGKLLRGVASPDAEGELVFKFLGKVGPIKLAVGLGAAFGAALTLPFIPGALIPDERPDVLARQLAGEEDVAVRRGRWWEFGRCLIKSNTYETVDGKVKTSDEIGVGDYLWGRGADPVEVTEIYKRHHKGPIYLFSVAHDRDIKTGLTGNHIVPVLRDGVVVEIEASKIQVNDYVEVPVKYLPTDTSPGSKFFDGRLFSCVSSIEIQDYDDTVYDFGVDHPDHLFQAGTFLVHNSKWEGDRIAYFRPHWYARMRGRAREISLWGENELPELSPVEKWFGQEFTYDLEKRHYKDRPYPISGTFGEDIPLVGPLVAGTIGQIIKPARLMHQDEMRDATGGYITQPLSYGGRFAPELGEQLPGAPISPFNATSTIGEQTYRMTEMMGLPGFMMTSMKEALTGTSDLFDQSTQLESSRRMFGFERKYWDLELGGLAGTTEAWRRLFPHRRRQIPLYNPIRNTMPEWLSGPEERGPDFLHGDPFTTIPEGELRLPGAGYATRFPELEGVAPEDYPLIHKFKILADVSPYSDKYKEHKRRVMAARNSPDWSEYEENIYQESMRQRREKQKSSSEFYEYQYLSSTGGIGGGHEKWSSEASSGVISELNQMNAERTGGKGPIASAIGGYWELVSHNMETPLEYLTPMSPASKLIHMRSPIEAYKATEVYGTANAFWQNPIRDFLRPTKNVLAAGLGFTSIPAHIQRKRAIQQYFDVLKYVKYDKLSGMAQRAGDSRAQSEFEDKKDETLFGINPYTYDFTSLFRSIPSSERNFIDAFMNAPTPETRAEIMELVPENQRGLLTARWQMSLTDDLQKAIKAGRLAGSQLAEANQIISQVSEAKMNEGFPRSKELNAEYWGTREPGENYGDWYRRTKLTTNYNLPGEGWVGWHPAVDLEDIKLKLLNEVGENMHDYGIYRDRAQRLNSKPFIDDSAIQPVLQGLRDPINSFSMLANTAQNLGGTLSIQPSYDRIRNDRVSVRFFQQKDKMSYLKGEY